MFLKFDLYRFDIQYFIRLADCISFNIMVQHVCFVKGWGYAIAGKEMLKYIQAFQKSPRFSLTSPLCQPGEQPCRPVFIKCGEPWILDLITVFLKSIITIFNSIFAFRQKVTNIKT